MAVPGTLLNQLFSRPLDGLLAAFLLVGALGFGDSASVLQAEQDEAPKVLLAQQPAKAPDNALPKIDYLSVGQTQGGDSRPYSLIKLLPNSSDQDEHNVGGSIGGGDTKAVHFDVAHQGVALGNGANAPAGGFGAPAPGRSAPAVPEPSEWALIVLGVVMASVMAYRGRSVDHAA